MNSSAKSFPTTFKNEPPIDFAMEVNRQKMRQALIDVKAKFGKVWPLIIGGEKIETQQQMHSVNPSCFDEIVGSFCCGKSEHVEQAVSAAREAANDWAQLGAAQRGAYLKRFAEIMRERLFELSAWEIYECGKNWREATNDVAEAIDFCEYYAAQAVLLEQPRGADVPGETNRFEYLPRGVVGVIAPWNFPIAIICGMVTAALATGNTVVMKPAEQATVCGALLMDVFEQANLPKGVVNFIPGKGEDAGVALVAHPDVAVIAFTGSRPVGLAINLKAAEVSASGIPMVKKVIAEMGGKNAVIVDGDADIDEAVMGVVKSAFGFQGQKCSACSRVIVVNSVYDMFVERLVASAESLIVGPSSEPGTQVGPVIDREAFAKVQQYIEIGKKEGRLALGVDTGELAKTGYFVGPHVFADCEPTCRLAQDEIFGPVLAILRVRDLDEAFRVANGTEYALTGGIFSRNPDVLDRARRELMVGNLYLNRGITGALVARQPFGGFKMSGIGSKAGGDDYLLQFVIPRTITENTLRRGFAPVEE